MIHANELRIGNYLLYNGKIDKVTAIDLDLDDENVPLVSFSDSNPVELNFGKVKPIYLTHEILGKCGVLDYSYDSQYRYKTVHLKLKNGEYYHVLNDGESDEMTVGIAIKYLHQLQNLNFVVKGEELTYTP